MINKEELEKLYLVDHLTMQQIGNKFGFTRAWICRLAKKYGIDASKAERFDVKCDICGTVFSTTRKRFTKSIKHFCRKDCYTRYLNNDEYKQNRTGQRRARKVVEEALGRSLRIGEIVHHEDGDNMNNELDNLKLFGSHSEHLAYHHRLRRDRLEVNV
jgi:predicted P-loop ATPase